MSLPPRFSPLASAVLSAVLALLLALAAPAAPALAQTPAAATAQLQELDAAIARAASEWEVPGLAVAVVKDGQVVFARGYGVRELGQPEPVDAAYAVRGRLDDQGDDRGADRHAGGRGQGRLGRSGDRHLPGSRSRTRT